MNRYLICRRMAGTMDLYLMADEEPANPGAADVGMDARGEALRWFEELREPLRRYLLCAGACAPDADDAVQESFLRLYRHLEADGARSNLRAWVFQVARNYLRDQRKSARHRKWAPLEGAMLRADGAGGPERLALDEERSRRLRAAVARLPEQQRECVLLRAAGLRYREIAAVAGVSVSSVGVLVARAVARLAEELA